MERKTYKILLDNREIGITSLEKADPPMGVVFGKVVFSSPSYNYKFFKNYCSENNIDKVDYSDDYLIETMDIPNMKVVDDNDNQIEGLATTISGMDSEGFAITIIGVSNSIFEKEFPHHIANYGISPD